ncbi:hypothetical protein C9374_010549 [Naegleria lovaniensis]|uniref:EGF-like domain-containing protein n=1 Tax=Naegleria lovaniensis TaxID=51637 RepID=A0AA88GBY7_NAELO|nr:uncharacterized protein C9374_010549 [Naegleria lovaniensis]KAG2374805.1 hypothetical protein C9374_010549 [Naegleria lovaniensis]
MSSVQHELLSIRSNYSLIVLFLCSFLLLFVNSSVAFTKSQLATIESTNSYFGCNGTVVSELRSIWKSSMKSYLIQQQVTQRLLLNNDTYALYDTQLYLANLVGMIRRCGNMHNDLLHDVASVLLPTFSKLEIDPRDNYPRWICRGEPYVQQAVKTSWQHVARWSLTSWNATIATRLPLTYLNVTDGSSKYFFSDKELWVITTVSELAGIYQRDPNLFASFATPQEHSNIESFFKGLLALLNARISIQSVKIASYGNMQAEAGDLDRGFDRLYADNRYAGYWKHETFPPVTCLANGTKIVNVPPSSVPIVDTSGWDISHARRLVQTFDALFYNFEAVKSIFHTPSSLIPVSRWRDAFSNALIGRIWNQDAQFPRFVNYWDGTPGWYRVDYSNGVTSCNPGLSPYALSSSIPTGGFGVWKSVNDTIQTLLRRIYYLNKSKASSAETSYLSAMSLLNFNTLNGLMFLPSLVGVNNCSHAGVSLPECNLATCLEYAPNELSPSCSNHGYCMGGNSCQCLKGFTGSRCELAAQPSSAAPVVSKNEESMKSRNATVSVNGAEHGCKRLELPYILGLIFVVLILINVLC